jgi:DOMON domain
MESIMPLTQHSKSIMGFICIAFTQLFSPTAESSFPAAVAVVQSDSPSQLLIVQGMEEKSVTVNGMQIQWHLQGGNVHVHLTAPTTGWVAVGFNTRDDIVGSNLIMAAVQQGQVRIEDQYVVRTGEHPLVTTLGGTSAVSNARGTEQNGRTSVSFAIAQHNTDRFHYNLTEAARIYLICAYSAEKDFGHHSRMRQHVEVML